MPVTQTQARPRLSDSGGVEGLFPSDMRPAVKGSLLLVHRGCTGSSEPRSRKSENAANNKAVAVVGTRDLPFRRERSCWDMVLETQATTMCTSSSRWKFPCR